MGNQFGRLFRVTTFGESHGKAVGVVIDGCPPQIGVTQSDIQAWLERRRPGQSMHTSARQEEDKVVCLAGTENDLTLGTPIALLVHNRDQRPADYRDLSHVLRPSHADYTYLAKYGVKAQSGGGRSSARETVGRVAAAAVASQVLKKFVPDLEILSWVDSVKDITCEFDPARLGTITAAEIEANAVRCPEPQQAQAMAAVIQDARKKGDTVGGCITTLIRNCPAGWGEPVFDKLEAQLAKAMLSLPAAKGFEIGSGFRGTKLYGAEHNDAFVQREGRVATATNRSGGVQGGITNGEDIYFRTAFKPVSTIFKEQETLDEHHTPVKFKPQKGRHDPCVLPRAVAIVDAMTVLVMVDNLLLGRLYMQV